MKIQQNVLPFAFNVVMFMMQNMTERGVSLIFRASEGRGPQKFSRGQAPGPPSFLAALALCPPKGRDLATPLSGTMQLVGLVDMRTEETSMRAMQTGQDNALVSDQVLQFTFIGNDVFRFPFAHWPTTNTSPGVLYFTFWRAVKWLMKTGFEVFYACLDGSEVNRNFVKLHFKDDDPVKQSFTIRNVHARRPFIFMMDPEVHYVYTMEYNTMQIRCFMEWWTLCQITSTAIV